MAMILRRQLVEGMHCSGVFRLLLLDKDIESALWWLDPVATTFEHRFFHECIDVDEPFLLTL